MARISLLLAAWFPGWVAGAEELSCRDELSLTVMPDDCDDVLCWDDELCWDAEELSVTEALCCDVAEEPPSGSVSLAEDDELSFSLSVTLSEGSGTLSSADESSASELVRPVVACCAHAAVANMNVKERIRQRIRFMLFSFSLRFFNV